jgi:uncharacterized phage protein (TIGR02220 family)
MDNGFIVIWRKITETSFYKTPNCGFIAMHLLLKASHKDYKFTFNKEEQTLSRGQILTGRNVLSAETGLSPQNVRTTLQTLKNCGFITIKSTNKFSVITISKYSDYQDKSTNKLTSQPTSKQPATNQQLTTYNNDNNVNNDNKEIGEFFSYYLLKTKKAFKLTALAKELIKKRMSEGFTLEQMKMAVDNFVSDPWEKRKERLDLIYCIGIRNKIDNLDKWINWKPITEGRRITA